MLRAEGVTKEFQHKRGIVHVLKDASFSIESGEYVSVVGASGSGKSTLLLMLGGMLSPTAGRVLLDGESLYELGSGGRTGVRREKIGFVFQTFNLIPYLTALENVQVPLMLSGTRMQRQNEIASDLLNRVGLSDRLEHKPSELSVGQQQRVALARMLANDPAVILADEPTGNLDPETGRQILQFLGEVNAQGRTVVVVTHDAEAATDAQRKLRLENGSVVPG